MKKIFKKIQKSINRLLDKLFPVLRYDQEKLWTCKCSAPHAANYCHSLRAFDHRCMMEEGHCYMQEKIKEENDD